MGGRKTLSPSKRECKCHVVVFNPMRRRKTPLPNTPEASRRRDSSVTGTRRAESTEGI